MSSYVLEPAQNVYLDYQVVPAWQYRCETCGLSVGQILLLRTDQLPPVSGRAGHEKSRAHVLGEVIASRLRDGWVELPGTVARRAKTQNVEIEYEGEYVQKPGGPGSRQTLVRLAWIRIESAEDLLERSLAAKLIPSATLLRTMIAYGRRAAAGLPHWLEMPPQEVARWVP